MSKLAKQWRNIKSYFMLTCPECGKGFSESMKYKFAEYGRCDCDNCSMQIRDPERCPGELI